MKPQYGTFIASYIIGFFLFCVICGILFVYVIKPNCNLVQNTTDRELGIMIHERLGLDGNCEKDLVKHLSEDANGVSRILYCIPSADSNWTYVMIFYNCNSSINSDKMEILDIQVIVSEPRINADKLF